MATPPQPPASPVASSLPPAGPGTIYQAAVNFAFTAAGDLTSFDQSAVRAGLLRLFPGATEVRISVTGASVNVDTTTLMASEDEANTAAATLASLPLTTLSSQLGVAVETTQKPSVSSQVVMAPATPSTPPPARSPSSPPALAPATPSRPAVAPAAESPLQSVSSAQSAEDDTPDPGSSSLLGVLVIVCIVLAVLVGVMSILWVWSRSNQRAGKDVQARAVDLAQLPNANGNRSGASTPQSGYISAYDVEVQLAGGEQTTPTHQGS